MDKCCFVFIIAIDDLLATFSMQRFILYISFMAGFCKIVHGILFSNKDELQSA